ncbi:MAG TPA: aminoglycoside phosphotransferase family protein [Mycobacteriales bacterium]|nr:aminoglycoside phosphotransferase family protein [Mycobacteriales bacterium]
MSLPRPLTAQPHYGRHLGDAGYWRPYIAEVLDRHGLPSAMIEAPFVGTFPTFLAGEVVVKLFGETFDGGQSYAAEHAMCTLLAAHPEIPAPELVRSGDLFDDDSAWHWPYLITQRLTGTAIRAATVPGQVRSRVAAELGRAVAALHRLPIPDAVAGRDLLPELHRDAPSRLRRFGLPEHLVEQVPEFLIDAPAAHTLVHADLTADHIFVDARGLIGVIDWSDAIVADPWYELVAVRFDGLSGDRELLRTFLDAYGWPADPKHAVRALQGVLLFQFNAIEQLADRTDLSRVASLDDLALRLFER